MQEPPRAPSIAMIGGPNTGKSHFTFQLFGRLYERSYGLRLRQLPNLNLFKDGLATLNSGLSAQHTNIDKYEDANLRLVTPGGAHIDLAWPDYGGEQIGLILQKRCVDEAWQQRMEQSEGLFLFIRPQEVMDYKNIVEHPLAVELERRSRADAHSELQLVSQVGIVEVLQMLLWAAHRDGLSPLIAPKLGVLLTCWDELGVGDIQPYTVLTDRLPLVEQFIRSNWSPASCFVMGVSALERPLDIERSDEEFVAQGPEVFGYVIQPDGTRTRDLTVPILRMLELLNVR